MSHGRVPHGRASHGCVRTCSPWAYLTGVHLMGVYLIDVANRPRLGGYSQARTLVHSYARWEGTSWKGTAGQGPAIRKRQVLDPQDFPMCICICPSPGRIGSNKQCFHNQYMHTCLLRAKIDVYLTGVHFMNMYFTGVHLMGVYPMVVHLMGVYLIGVYLIGVHLMACISYISYRHASLTGAYLTGVHLRGRPYLSCQARIASPANKPSNCVSRCIPK